MMVMNNRIGDKVRVNSPDSPWVHDREGYLGSYDPTTGSTQVVDDLGRYVAQVQQHEIDFIEDPDWIDQRIDIVKDDLAYHKQQAASLERMIETLEKEKERQCPVCDGTRFITTTKGQMFRCPECGLDHYALKYHAREVENRAFDNDFTA